MLNFIKDFCEVVGQIIKEEKFVQYTRESKGAGLYYKIERTVFEEYISKLSKLDKGEFLRQCIAYGLIKSEKTRSRRCVYSVGNMKFYFVNKVFIDAALKDADRSEA